MSHVTNRHYFLRANSKDVEEIDIFLRENANDVVEINNFLKFKSSIINEKNVLGDTPLATVIKSDCYSTSQRLHIIKLTSTWVQY